MFSHPRVSRTHLRTGRHVFFSFNQSFIVTAYFTDESAPIQIDLSKATRLRVITFQSGSTRIGWIARTLETITVEHQGLQRIVIGLDRIAGLGGADPSTMGWLDLDRLLVQFRESRFVHAWLGCTSNPPGWLTRYTARLFPELTKREIVDLVEKPFW